MRLLVVALALLVPNSAGAAAFQKAPLVKGVELATNCPRTTTYHAYRAGEPLKPRTLGELPDANAYKAVLRHDGRCEVPVIVKYGVSSGR